MSLGPRYVPDYRLRIGGEPIPSELRASITSVTHESGLEGADRVELSLVNEGLRWLDHDLIAVGRDLALDLGYADGSIDPVFVGDIVSQSASFPSGGPPTMSVGAQDKLVTLQSGTKTRDFGIPVPTVSNYRFAFIDVGVAGLVTLEHLLVPTLDPIGAALSLVLAGVDVAASPEDEERLMRHQKSESDYDFLSRIATENGWELMIRHTGALAGYELRFMSPLSHLDADVRLAYGESLIDFSPRISEVGQTSAYTAEVPLFEAKVSFSVTVGWDWDRAVLTLSVTPSLPIPLQLGPDSEVIDEPLTLQAAPRYLVSKLIPRLNQRVTCSGSTVGDPRIVAGAVIQIEGVGEQFGGLYRVTSATHTLDSGGFQTRFEGRKEIWFGSIPLPDQGAVRVNNETIRVI